MSEPASAPADPTDPSAPASARSQPAWMGKRVGRFKLLALLGQGGMGKVFRALDTTLQRQVALKTLPKVVKTRHHSIDAEQLVREARSAATIEHPHVVHIYEAGEHAGVYYIAMELLEGGSLQDLVKAHGPLDPVRACQLVAEAAEGLDHAHALGIVHRDVKPSNLMLTRAGRCKVADFGLARVDDPADAFVPLGETVGTPQFIAPEVIRGATADARSDVYALGATLWYLLTGRAPFVGDTKQDTLRRQLNDPLPDIRQTRSDLPEGLVLTLAKSMAKDPADRFPSAGVFASALRVQTIPLGGSSGIIQGVSGSVAGLIVPGSHVQPAPAAVTPPPRAALPMKWILAGLAAAFAIAVGLGFYFAGPKSKPADLAAAPAPQPQPQSPAQPPPAAQARTAASTEKPAPPPAPQAEPPAPAADAIPATDTAALTKIANGEDPDHPDKKAVVEGLVKTAATSPSGKVFRIEFGEPNARDTFIVAVFPGKENAMFKRMEEKFGGKDGANLAGQKVRIRGTLEIYNTHPEIKVTDIAQIEVVK